MTGEIEAAIAALADDPTLSGLLGPDAAAVVWSRDVSRVLWESTAGAAARSALGEPQIDHLRALAAGLTPGDGVRLERFRFDKDRLRNPATLACRVLPLAGGDALLTVFAGDLPESASDEPGRTHAPAAGGEEAQDVADRLDAIRARGMRRFIWSADREGRFTSVSSPLGEVVGAQNGDIVGLRWADLIGRVAIDETGAVAESFAGRDTWSGRTVRWRIAGTRHAVAVDLGGMPTFGRGHEFEGFRGFGLCRVDDIAALAEAGRGADAPVATAPERLADRVESGDVMTMAGSGALAEDRGGGFGAMQVRIGAQLGASRPVPLRPVAAPEAPAPAADGAAGQDNEQGNGQADRPILSVAERGAFREIARALGARLPPAEEAGDDAPARPSADILTMPPPRSREPDAIRVLDRLPAGIIVLRGETPLFLNRFMLDLVGYDDAADLVAGGGVSRLFSGRTDATTRSTDAGSALTLVTRSGASLAVDARLTTIEWGELPASLMLVRPILAAAIGPSVRSLELELASRDVRLAAAAAALDIASVGLATIDEAGRVLALSPRAETLFGYAQNEVAGETLTALLDPASHRAALDVVDALRTGADAAGPVEREIAGRHRDGRTMPLVMRAGRIDGGRASSFAVAFTDISSFKRTEAELGAAKRAAEGASLKQSEFLARVSHEIRTPLNAIIGFAEIMMEERFGAIGNERYKLYLKDIHDSGNHVVSLVNDLLDIAKVASGKSELSFTSMDLNEVVSGSVGLLQPSAARERVVVRTAFAPDLPRIIADERSIRQIALNLIANAIRFTGAGGQVIVSTGPTDRGDIALRIRDTGIGMSADEIDAALEPFRQITVSRRGEGTGLGLPLSKALVDANHGVFSITSAKHEGTLIEVLFPRSRILAD